MKIEKDLKHEEKRKFGKYWKEMSPEVQEAPVKVKNLWIQWYKKREEVRSSEHRFYEMSTPKGVDVIDCSGIFKNAKNKCIRLGGTKVDIKAIEDQCNKMKELQGEQGDFKRPWTALLKKNIVKQKKHPLPTVLELKRTQILELFGKWWKIEDVFQTITQEWELKIEYDELKQFFKNNHETIEYLRNRYVKANDNFHVATDTGRMETLAKLHLHWMREFEKSPSLMVSKEIRGIIEQVKKEVKGDQVVLKIDGTIDVEATKVANKTLDQILGQLPINNMIVGLVAAKANIDPTTIIASLTNSYYKDYNGFIKLDNEEQAPGIQKFIANYSWGELKASVPDNQKVKSFQEIEEVEEVVEVEMVKAKETVMDLLMSYKNTAAKVKESKAEERAVLNRKKLRK